MKPIVFDLQQHPLAAAAEEHRSQCLAWQRGVCSGTPVCLRCGTLRQALILATWVNQSWPDCSRILRPLQEADPSEVRGTAATPGPGAGTG